MTRTRYIFPADGSPSYEVPVDFVGRPREAKDVGVLWNPDRGYENLPPENGVPINSRTKHREYMASRGLTTMDDYKSTWDHAAKERAAYFKGERPTITKRDIAESIERLQSR